MIEELLFQVINFIRAPHAAEPSDAEALGIAIAEFFEWDTRVIDMAQKAIEEINAVSLNRLIDDWKETNGL